jgi:hypothetical protein
MLSFLKHFFIILTLTPMISSRQSSYVDIMIGYGLDSQGFIPSGDKKLFSSPQHPNQLWSPPSHLSNGYWGLFPHGLKQSGCEAYHSSGAKDKNGGAILSLPHTSSWHCT